MRLTTLWAVAPFSIINIAQLAAGFKNRYKIKPCSYTVLFCNRFLQLFSEADASKQCSARCTVSCLRIAANFKKVCFCFKRCAILFVWSNRVTRWLASPHLKKRGGGANGYIRSIEPVIFGRFVSDCAACLC